MRGWFTLTRSRRVVKTRSSLTCGSGPDFMMVELRNKCNYQFNQLNSFISDQFIGGKHAWEETDYLGSMHICALIRKPKLSSGVLEEKNLPV